MRCGIANRCWLTDGWNLSSAAPVIYECQHTKQFKCKPEQRIPCSNHKAYFLAAQTDGPINRVLLLYYFGNAYTLLTPWSSRVPLEKSILTQLVAKFHAFYGNRGFITVLTRSREIWGPF
jgi:hypothetical protein